MAKCMKKLRQINAKVKLDKSMHELCQNHENLTQNGSRNRRKVNQKSFKKSLRKFIGQNVEKSAPNVTPRGAQGQPCPGSPWARSAGKR